jgi:DNA-binding CsgD family transcriptional regulator
MIDFVINGTPMERKILAFLAAGLSTHQIAAASGLSKRTIAFYVYSLKRKNDVAEISQLVARYIPSKKALQHTIGDKNVIYSRQ